MSYLSVFVQYHAQVELAFTVPAAAFEPAPEVDSAIIVGLTRARRLDEADEQLADLNEGLESALALVAAMLGPPGGSERGSQP